VESEKGTIETPVKYWEIIADNLSKAGWSWEHAATSKPGETAVDSFAAYLGGLLNREVRNHGIDYPPNQ
jgi:hypothetical protein